MQKLKELSDRIQQSEIAARFVGFARSISIKKLLGLSLIALVSGNLAIVGATSILLNREAQWEKVRELEAKQALALAQEVKIRLNDLQQELSYLQKLRGLTALPQEVQRTLLEGMTRQNHAYETIAIVSREGEILSAIAPYSRGKATQIALAMIKKPGLAVAIREQTRYIAPVEWHQELNVPTAEFVLPLQDRDGRPNGVLVAMINLDFLNGVVARSQIGKTGYVYILDAHNRVIAKQRAASEIHQTARLEPLRDRALIAALNKNRFEIASVYQGLRGVEVLGTSSDIYSVNWRIVVELPLREVYAPIRRSIGAMLIILAIAIIISILLSIQIARSLISPLESLTQAANQISRGEFSTRVNLDYRNEWGILARAFNKMTARIQDSFQTLERKNNELSDTLATLKETQLQLVQKEKMSGLGQLVAGVAHEINNPINFIHGNLIHTEEYTRDLLDLIELYQKHYPHANLEIQDRIEEIDLEFLKEDFSKVVSSIKMGSERVRTIVDSLRNFSRLDESSFKEVDLHEGLENTLLILQNRLKGGSDRHAITLVKNYGELPRIYCYPAQLNQVFMNLLNNAIDAVEPFRRQNSERQPEIQIVTEYAPIDDNPSDVSIRITDNGEGISENVREQIFNPFFSTKPIGKGTGLGLSISYQIIVETHQGKLDCFSTVGEGTSFQIQIPSQLVPAT